MEKIKYSSMYGKFGNNEKEVGPIDNIIMYKTTIRIGDGINSTIKKEVNVPVIPTCKTCNKRRSACAKNNIVCDKYSLLNEKKKKLGTLQTTLKADTSSNAINNLKSFYRISKGQATECYNKWRYDYVRSVKEW